MSEADQVKLHEVHEAVFGNGNPSKSLIVQVGVIRRLAYAILGVHGAIFVTLLGEALNG